jgi:PAS domain S-box-containing protein
MRAIVSPDGTREIASVMHDITKKKLLRLELQQQRQYFNALMDSAPDHIYFKDVDSRFILINRAMARLFKLAKPEDAIGFCDGDFFGEPHVSHALAAEREIIRTGHGILNVEEEENWPDGSVTWASTTKMPLYGEDGRISGTMGVSRNITKRKLAEITLLEKTKLLTDLNADLKREMDSRRALESQLLQAQKLESIGQLAAGVAHELNTPIQYVADNCRFLDESFRGLNEMLRHYGKLLVDVKAGRPAQQPIDAIEELAAALDLEFLSSEVPHAIEQSIDGIDRVAQIVRAMKEFSHPGSREKSPVDLNHGIENTLVVCRNEYKYVAQLETDFTPDLPPVYCLAGEINQAVLNLIVNASHAVKDAHPDGGGIIRVSTHRDGEFVEIRVRDNGTGIPEAIQNRIFEPFFTTKEVGKGSGQGLALARNVAVHKHNGSLTFETRENEGTTFMLRIPVGPEPRRPEEIEAERTGLVELTG